MQEPSLALISPWFGPWPTWINLYLESCSWNPWVTWLIPTDQEPPENQPPNVTFMPMSLAQFVKRIEDVAGLHLTVRDAYKITDFKPLLGAVFEEEIASFTHFGYTDQDIIYGQLDCELTTERLRQYEIISSHGDIQSGHLSVFQNTPRLRSAWQRMPGCRRLLKSPEHRVFDEVGFGRRLNPNKWHPPWRRYRILWHEMFSMPDRDKAWADGGPQPTRMFWKSGRLTEPRNAMPQYAYLHFMLWRSGRYRGGPAPWESLNKVLHIDWRQAAEHGFEISHDGFTPRRPD